MQQNIIPEQHKIQQSFTNNKSRRQFVTTLTKAVGGAAVLATPFVSNAAAFFTKKNTYTVGQIMDLFIKQVPGAPFEETVDTLKAGNRDIVVTGIVTTMFATVAVIKKAVDLGANFIIAHEPTFYNHLDATDWLKDDAVYTYKAALLKQHNIAVWRNHDYVHSLIKDGVTAGVLAKLGWEKYAFEKRETINLDAPISLQNLIKHTKQKLDISMLRYIGDLQAPCKKILLMPGAAGGKAQIETMIKTKPDVLICGEVQEWETPEYIRDARAKGEHISLIILGHIASEEPGSGFMVTWLKQNVAGITATHVPATNSLSFL